MRKYLLCLMASFLIIPILVLALRPASYHSTKVHLEAITPEDALKKLIEGNARFVNNTPIKRNLLRQAKVSSLTGQFPAAIILSCMDSRGSPELILDQGLGDIFSVRVAGNVIDTDQIASMEYATQVVGSKIIVVMGHTQCGAVKGACEDVHLGHVTDLLQKIQPAVKKVAREASTQLNCAEKKTVDRIAKQNVLDMMQQIKEGSTLIQDQLRQKQVLLVGAMHDLESGRVFFFDEAGQDLKVD